MSVIFDVVGTPVAQGSVRAFVVGSRAVVTHENKPPLRAWRDALANAAATASREADVRYPRPTAVRVTAEFRLPRPKSQTKKQKLIKWVSAKPDLDKLGRSLLDALSASHVFDDDAQVSMLWITKVYAKDDETLGAWVSVSAAP